MEKHVTNLELLGVSGFISLILGVLNPIKFLLIGLAVLIMFDFITAFFRVLYNSDEKLSPDLATKGLIKKLQTFILLFAVVILEAVTSLYIDFTTLTPLKMSISGVFVIYYILIEFISIWDNVQRSEVSLPKAFITFIKDVLSKLFKGSE